MNLEIDFAVHKIEVCLFKFNTISYVFDRVL